ncbi:hypothetical protein [Cupriavidus malaysiensis]|uniref:Uncharacterized protein n=1 Tax=Cupriavidus malaysiensis TaxID=367825 RepID=A0ABM6F3H9_9BURK|nr:hypothetical protein [Cupriavidus malaysiensis]AOZ05940.1 hypothetical protein BKK80_08960 [Cupriavidus malaysiensis]
MENLDLLQMATNAGGTLEGPSSVRMRPTHLEHIATRIIRAAGAVRTLLEPVPVERDQHGYFFHPALPAQRGADFRLDWFAFANGFDVKSVVMEDDELPAKACERYLGPAGDFSDWAPKSPAGKGWFCLAIYDCEEGPTAVYVREVRRLAQDTCWRVSDMQPSAPSGVAQ